MDELEEFHKRNFTNTRRENKYFNNYVYMKDEVNCLTFIEVMIIYQILEINHNRFMKQS